MRSSGVDVVPKVSISGAGGGQAGGDVIQALLTMLMADKLELPIVGEKTTKSE